MKKQIVYDITIQQQVKKTGFRETAQLLGLTVPAVRQMIQDERILYLRKIKGKWHYSEYKDWRRGTNKNGRPENLKRGRKVAA